MKTLSTLLAALVTNQVSAQGTLIHRIDMSRGTEPYHTTAVILESGWEFWAFGSTRSDLLDLEIGKLFPVGAGLYVGGYLIWWPEFKKTFVAPALSYNQDMLGGQLSVFAATYVPLNGGPRIVIVDDASLIWKNGNTGYGLAANYFQFDRDPANLRIGPTVRLPIGKTTNLKLSYQPVFLVGHGQPVWRVELATRF